jgi:hypothetical protein
LRTARASFLIGRGPLRRHDACPIQANRPPELRGARKWSRAAGSQRRGPRGSPPRPGRIRRDSPDRLEACEPATIPSGDREPPLCAHAFVLSRWGGAGSTFTGALAVTAPSPSRMWICSLAFRVCLRLGESAWRADRVEGVLKFAPGPVAEADACYRGMDPPQLPRQSIEWCGVVWAVHLALSMQRPRLRRGYGVRTQRRSAPSAGCQPVEPRFMRSSHARRDATMTWFRPDKASLVPSTKRW